MVPSAELVHSSPIPRQWAETRVVFVYVLTGFQIETQLKTETQIKVDTSTWKNHKGPSQKRKLKTGLETEFQTINYIMVS